MNLASFRLLTVGTAGVCLAWPAVAHPGHGLSEHGALHLVTSPFHVVTLLGVGVVLWLASHLATQRSVRRWFATAGTACVSAAGVFWGLGV